MFWFAPRDWGTNSQELYSTQESPDVIAGRGGRRRIDAA